MALIACHECKQQISDEAKICPSCGAKPLTKTSLTTWVIGGVLMAAILMGIVKKQSEPPSTPLTAAEQAKKDATNRQQTAALAMASALKSALKDPDSFELKRLVVKDDGSGCYTYRARNSFNAMLQSSAVFVPTPGGGQMLTETTDAKRFVTEWNKRCTKDGGEDITDYAVRFMR